MIFCISNQHDPSSRYDDDDTYLDAAEMLSRSESFFNCSNFSGHGILVEPSGTLSRDKQTQDLMMGRFLPAAKALTSDTLLTRKHLNQRNWRGR